MGLPLDDRRVDMKNKTGFSALRITASTVGVLAGVAGIGINTQLTWWRFHLPINLRQFLAKL
jgi:hypothetical protein